MSSINRPAHLLRREKTLAIPRHMVLFDTETNQSVGSDGSIVHSLKLGWACYFRRAAGRQREIIKWQFFTDADTFWQWVLSFSGTKSKLWVIAHNVNFDFTVVSGWWFLRQAEYKCRFFYSNGMTTIISVRKPKSSIVFVDTLNWFPESLEKLGDRVGMPKLKIDFEKADFEYLKTYCKRDVEILLATMKNFIRFLQGNQVSRLCYTIGSTAMAAYLRNCYHTPIYIHNNREALELERLSYRGGRTECFYLGELNHAKYTFLDFNSQYPHTMCIHSFPVKYVRCGHHLSESNLQTHLKNYAVIATVQLETQEPAFAVKRDRTLFPVGCFTVTLCTPELQYALDRNMIRSIGRYVIYEQANIFTAYIRKFYQLRQNFRSVGADMYDHCCKKLLNCLCGKFGQKAEEWTKIGVCPDEPDRVEDVFSVSGGTKRKLRYLLGEVFELTGYGEAFDSFPAISAHVTAFARMYLWELMKVAGPGHYYYCDTDSLVVDPTGLERLQPWIDPVELGKLKIESQHDSITFYGAKDYVTDTKTVSKGIRSNAERVDVGVYRQDRWPSLRGLLRDNDVATYTVRKVTKRLKRQYTKGTVTPDGWIDPFVLGGDS